MPHDRLELFTLKNRSFSALLLCGKTRGLVAAFYRNRCFGKHALCGLLIAAATLGLTACGPYYYKFPVYTFANRPIPPSKLAERVMISVGNAGAGGAGGALAIVDALRDIRSNVQNTVTSFSISGFSAGNPGRIFSFPEQTRGYVYSNADGSLTTVNYGTESASGSGGSFPARSTSLAIPTDFARIFSAEEGTGQLVVLDNSTGKGYALNLPNVYQVAANIGDTVALAMVRNSNTLYQVVKLNANQANPAGAVDCQPYNLPVYCVVPVPGNYDRPIGAYFSVDGTTAYILNCGPECGGTTASVNVLEQGALNIKQCSDGRGDYSGYDRHDPGTGRGDDGAFRREHAVRGWTTVAAGWLAFRQPVDDLAGKQYGDGGTTRSRTDCIRGCCLATIIRCGSGRSSVRPASAPS